LCGQDAGPPRVNRAGREEAWYAYGEPGERKRHRPTPPARSCPPARESARPRSRPPPSSRPAPRAARSDGTCAPRRQCPERSQRRRMRGSEADPAGPQIRKAGNNLRAAGAQRDAHARGRALLGRRATSTFGLLDDHLHDACAPRAPKPPSRRCAAPRAPPTCPYPAPSSPPDPPAARHLLQAQMTSSR
jgi:hypothetical protein